MTRLTLHCGDVGAVLAAWASEQFDAVLCDPPYGLSDLSTRDTEDLLTAWLAEQSHDTGPGFMQRKWDVVPAPTVWRAALRVCKPGAFALAFGGTRTQDLLTLGLRLGGFSVRDVVQWMYACLSSDTEILTQNGWERYDTLTCGLSVMCYNIDSDTFEWEQVEEVHTYEVADTVYRIKSDTTDQIVTAGHRCLVEREGKLLFQFAGDVAPEREIRVPFLEVMPAVRQTVHVRESHAGAKEQVLFCGVHKEELSREKGSKEKEPKSMHRNGASNMRGLWEGLLEEQKAPRKSGSCLLFEALSWGSIRSNTKETRAQSPCGVASRECRELAASNDRAKQSSMEGRRDIPQETWELQRGEVCTLSTRIYSYGAQGWLRYGASACSCSGAWKNSKAKRGSTSQRPRPIKQRHNQLDAFRKQFTTQEIREVRGTKTTLARIEPMYYEGVVWCVTVPTGAFVARRNGQIFITGNSGFPKGRDISKAIDAEAGLTRDVVGRRVCESGGKTFHGGEYKHGEALPITAPASATSAQWDGYNTALRPAHEPIVVAQAPREGTFAHNAVTHGCGALNIDGCRIERGERPARENDGTVSNDGIMKPSSGMAVGTTTRGGWPQNVLFSHAPGCRKVGTRRVKNRGTHPDLVGKSGDGENKGMLQIGSKVQSTYADADGYETVDDWQCAPGCPVRELAEQSGELTSGSILPHHKKRASENIAMSGANYERPPTHFQGDTGTAARFFYCAKSSPSERHAGLDAFYWQRDPARLSGFRRVSQAAWEQLPRKERAQGNIHSTVKPLEILRYLATLLLPPERDTPRRLLVPFCGSGSEVLAALQAGWDEVVGIDLVDDYLSIARARVAYWDLTGTVDTVAPEDLPPQPALETPQQGRLF